jgi:hypothetical protein
MTKADIIKSLCDKGLLNYDRPDCHIIDIWGWLNKRWQYWLFVFAQDLLPYDQRCAMREDPATYKNLHLARVAVRLCKRLRGEVK